MIIIGEVGQQASSTIADGKAASLLRGCFLSFFCPPFPSLSSYSVPSFGFDYSLAFASSLTEKLIRKETRLLCLLSFCGFLVA